MHTVVLLSALLIQFAFVFSFPFDLLRIPFDIRTGESTVRPIRLSRIVGNRLIRPAQLARAVYCDSAKLRDLSCGPTCDAIRGVHIITTGGDGDATPLFFIAFDPSTRSVVVAHQGSDASKFMSLLNDLKFALVPLDTSAIPNAPSNVRVHDGFQDAFLRTSGIVLSTVRNVLAANRANKVLLTGHSLGGAIASMDAVMLRRNLDPSIIVRTVVFGMPRVGNKAWADLVDSTLGSSFIRVTNQADPIAIIPPRFLSFQHPAGELHITSVDGNGQVTGIVFCPGQDNANCAAGNSLLQGNINNHFGPWVNNIFMGFPRC